MNEYQNYPPDIHCQAWLKNIFKLQQSLAHIRGTLHYRTFPIQIYADNNLPYWDTILTVKISNLNVRYT